MFWLGCHRFSGSNVLTHAVCLFLTNTNDCDKVIKVRNKVTCINIYDSDVGVLSFPMNIYTNIKRKGDDLLVLRTWIRVVRFFFIFFFRKNFIKLHLYHFTFLDFALFSSGAHTLFHTSFRTCLLQFRAHTDIYIVILDTKRPPHIRENRYYRILINGSVPFWKHIYIKKRNWSKKKGRRYTTNNVKRARENTRIGKKKMTHWINRLADWLTWSFTWLDMTDWQAFRIFFLFFFLLPPSQLS